MCTRECTGWGDGAGGLQLSPVPPPPPPKKIIIGDHSDYFGQQEKFGQISFNVFLIMIIWANGSLPLPHHPWQKVARTPKCSPVISRQPTIDLIT